MTKGSAIDTLNVQWSRVLFSHPNSNGSGRGRQKWSTPNCENWITYRLVLWDWELLDRLVLWSSLIMIGSYYDRRLLWDENTIDKSKIIRISTKNNNRIENKNEIRSKNVDWFRKICCLSMTTATAPAMALCVALNNTRNDEMLWCVLIFPQHSNRSMGVRAYMRIAYKSFVSFSIVSYTDRFQQFLWYISAFSLLKRASILLAFFLLLSDWRTQKVKDFHRFFLCFFRNKLFVGKITWVS